MPANTASHIEREESVRRYFGRAGRFTVSIVARDETELYISRVYNIYEDKIKMCWFFNGEGRLRKLNFTPLYCGVQIPTSLIEVQEQETRETETATLQPLPSEMAMINQGLPSWPAKRQYHKLICFGYTMARDLEKRLEEDTLEAPPFTLPGQLPLPAIKDDFKTREMIEKTTGLFPLVKLLESDRLDIVYYPYRPHQ